VRLSERFRRRQATGYGFTLEAHRDATIEEAALVASCLAALPSGSFQEAVKTLRAMTETATKQQRARGIA
jgi:hypothetical protein